MRVQRLVDGETTWTVVDERGVPVGVVDDFLAYLQAIERSPNTIRAYAHDLKTFWAFLRHEGLSHEDVTGEDLARFIRFLRRPHPDVSVISEDGAARKASTVNRVMAAVSGLYTFLADRGTSEAGERLLRQARLARRPTVALLDGIPKRESQQQVVGPRLKPQPTPLTVLTVEQARAVIDACSNLRDRLLFTILFTTGMRRGQALGLRHEDLDTRARTITIRPRPDNENGARAKTRETRVIPVTTEVTRLYLDYMHTEYGAIDSDYVFINLWGGDIGRAMTDKNLDAVVKRLRTRTAIEGWSCHTLRHTWATLHHRAGMPIEVISHLLTHGNVVTTAEIYTHMDAEDLRRTLERHGCLEAT